MLEHSPLTRLLLVECCFTSTETVGLLGTEAQDGHLDFHTAPELDSAFFDCQFYSTSRPLSDLSLPEGARLTIHHRAKKRKTTRYSTAKPSQKGQTRQKSLHRDAAREKVTISAGVIDYRLQGLGYR